MGGLEPWSSEALWSLVSASQRLRDRLNMKSRHWAYRFDVSAFDLGDQTETPQLSAAGRNARVG
jgi:hypothetical protein